MTDVMQVTNRMPKVLIADDDPGIVRFLAGRCAKMGFDVQTASNGLQALMMAGRSPPDVLIVDVNMPEADGLSVCMRLLRPGRAPLEIIVVTGSTNPETLERCRSFGAYFACKGPAFWETISAALIEIFPKMSEAIADDAKSPFPAQDMPAKVWSRPRVLIVDDDPDVEKFLCSRLAKFGVDTLYASDGTKGFRIACKEEPSAIISDYLMPNGDAIYLLGKLRNNPVTANIPFFVMSGQPLDKVTEQSLQREICGRPGAARILSKQFDTHELFAALQDYCAFDHTPIAK